MEIRELIVKRNKLVNQARDVQGRAEKEERKMSADEREQVDKLLNESDELLEEIQIREKLESAEIRKIEKEIEKKEPEKKEVNHNQVYRKWMVNGSSELTPEERALMHEARGTSTQITTTDGLGGYTVPEEWAKQIVEVLLSFGGVYANATVERTGGGDVYHIPTINDTGTSGSIISEGTAETVSDLTFTEVTLGTYTYTSGLIKLSWELMNDTLYDLSGLVARLIGNRLGRITNTHFTTGDNSGKPNGIVTASAEGKVAASATAITLDELIDLKYSVNRAYQANAKFMMKTSTLSAVRKLKDQNDQYLWQPSVQAGVPDQLLGKPVIINDDMAAIAADAKTVLYGDFAKYVVREVKGFELVRLNERFADARATGFFGYGRWDADCVDSTAIKHLVQAS